MRDNLSIAIMMIILVLLAVIFPLYNYFERQDDMSYNLVLKATTNFVDEVINSGYISQEMYDSYVSNIANTGNLYDIQLEAKRKVYVKSENGIEYEEQYAVDYNDEIFDLNNINTGSNLDSRIIKDGVYKLNEGDQIYVKLKNSSTSMAASIFQTIVPTATKETIKVNYGGIIKNNAWKQFEVSDVATEELVISYDTMGGTPNNIANTVKRRYLGQEDIPMTLTEKTPSRTGRNFLGWSEDKLATVAKYESGKSYGFSNSTTLYAIYDIQNVEKPTITVKRTDDSSNVVSNTWVNSNVSITITPAISEPGYITYYSLNNGSSWIQYNGAIVYSAEGSNVILAKTKFESRESDETSFAIKIDKIPPNIPSANTSATRDTITVSAYGSTDGNDSSGFKKYQYRINNTSWKDDYTFTGLVEDTTYNIFVRAVDNAGNYSGEKQVPTTTQKAPVTKLSEKVKVGDYISLSISGMDSIDNYITCDIDYSIIKKWIVVGIYGSEVKVVPESSVVSNFNLKINVGGETRKDYNDELKTLFNNISSSYISTVRLPTAPELSKINYEVDVLLSKEMTGDSDSGMDSYNYKYITYYDSEEKTDKEHTLNDWIDINTYLCPALMLKEDIQISKGSGAPSSPYTLK